MSPIRHLHIRPKPLKSITSTLCPPSQHHRTLTSSHALLKKSASLPPRPTLPDHDLKHVYLKGSGPGGQKINKTSSAVQLTHIPTGLVVKSQATRSQSQNHTIARRILAEKVELLEKGTESRAAKIVERKQKRKASAAKKSRRKYRRLEEGGKTEGEELGDVEWEEEEEGRGGGNGALDGAAVVDGKVKDTSVKGGDAGGS